MMKVVAVALAYASVSHGSEVSPIEKVVQMMEDLQTQVITEGKAEATTYDKFACFCKDTQNEKTTAITEAQDSIAELTGSINQLSADREDLDTEISELNEKIEANAKAQKEADALRAKQKAQFVKEQAEMEKAIADLGSAVDTMKEGSGEAMGMEVGLIQLAPVLRTVRKAVWMADALGHHTARHAAVLAMLQGASKATATTADTHDIVDTVEDLEGDFKKKLADLEATETNRIAEHNLQMQQLHDEKNAAEKDLKEAQELKAEKMEGIAQDQQELSATNAQMTDDQAYIKDLTEKCNHKSREWDQRSDMRSQELTALSTALTIVKERVGTKATGTVRLVEEAATVSKPVVVVPPQTGDADDDAEVDSIAQAESFLQLSHPRARLAFLAAARVSPDSQQEAKRDFVLSLLKTRGASIGSAVLTSLVSRVSADPFAKIKQLIQELVERLLQEAADEANHKGWCDKELGKAKQARKLKSEAVEKLNSQLASNEALRDKLTEETTVLGEEIDALTASLDKMTSDRKEESAENKATVTEAEEGKAAIEEAIQVLDRFYKTAAKAQDPELLQQPVADDLPDAGFGGANTGSQAASEGILGMMEVILSDFERTIATTDKLEKEAQAEFLEFETTTKVSMGKKTAMKSNKETELTETTESIQEDNTSLTEEQSLLDKAIQEIIELQPACVETGMSYEDRVAKREQEIESLKEALCVLDKEGPVQTEGC